MAEILENNIKNAIALPFEVEYNSVFVNPRTIVDSRKYFLEVEQEGEIVRESVKMRNSSGAQVASGDILVAKGTATGDDVTTTTTAGDNAILRGGGFMALETIDDGDWGNFLRKGITTILKVNGTTDIAVGDRLTTFTTAGIAQKAAVGDPYFATAQEAFSTDDSTGIIDALLVEPGAEDPAIPSFTWIPAEACGLTGGATRTTFGDYDAVNLRDAATDGINVSGFIAVVPVAIQVIFRAQDTADIAVSVTTDFAAAGEAFNNTSDSIATSAFSVVNNDLNAIDVIAAFTGAAANDFYGMVFSREGADALDTSATDGQVIGVLVTY